MSTVLITTGVPGSGKTFVRCARFLVDDFLLHKTGVHYSNFPVNIDVVSEYVYKRITRKNIFSRVLYKFFRDFKLSDVSDRIHIIPDAVIKSWRDELSGPWDYFSGVDLKYAHIAIDEIHEIISSSSSAAYVQKWDEFLGTIRHRGCTFEGITQDYIKVNRVLSGRASIRLELSPCEDLRDPFFSIRMMDWYELKASFFGEFHKSVIQTEFKKSGSGRFVKNHVSVFLIDPFYFQFYNSYNATTSENDLSSSDGFMFPVFGSRVDKSDSSGDRVPKYEYEKRSRFGMLIWFVSRNWWHLFTRIIVFVLVAWLCFFGGFPFLISRFVNFITYGSRKSSVAVVSSSSGDISSLSSGDISLKKSPYRIALLDFNNVIFANGFMISRGESFPAGTKYGGLYVKDFDVKRRCVVLSDGTILRMREYSED